MMRSLFFGSLLALCLSYVLNKEKQKWLDIIIECVFLAGSFLFLGNVGLLVIVGFLIRRYQSLVPKMNRKLVTLGLIISLVLLWGLAELIIDITPLSSGLISYIKVIIAIVIFVSILHEESLQRIFAGKVLTGIGKISFPVFGFHWPIMCSAGAFILCMYNDNYPVGFFFSLFTTLVITLAVSAVFHVTVEKWTSKLIQQLQKATANKGQESRQ